MVRNDYRSEHKATLIRFGFGPDVMKRWKVCNVCGATSPSTEEYCGSCGAVLPQETLFDLYKSKHFYCPACDTVVTNSARYCPACGRRLHRR